MNNNSNHTSGRPRGRPRKFDRDQVLDCAVNAFWSMGYSGTSLDDLTKAMGINRPSLYATFGNKHDLFMAAIDRYAKTFGCQPVDAFFGESDIKKSVEAFLQASIRCVTQGDGPKGCLVASVATEDAEIDIELRNKLSGMFDAADKLIAERFQSAQDEGQLPQDVDPHALARMIVSITHSFSARARVGANRKELSRLAKDFMTALFPIPV